MLLLPGHGTPFVNPISLCAWNHHRGFHENQLSAAPPLCAACDAFHKMDTSAEVEPKAIPSNLKHETQMLTWCHYINGWTTGLSTPNQWACCL